MKRPNVRRQRGFGGVALSFVLLVAACSGSDGETVVPGPSDSADGEAGSGDDVSSDDSVNCDPDLASLSSRAANILRDVSQTDVLRESPVAEADLVSHCNGVHRVFIDGPEIYDGIRSALSEADHEIALAFFTWDADSEAADKIGDGIRSASARLGTQGRLIVRMLIGDSENDSSRTITGMRESVATWGNEHGNVEYQLSTFPHGFNNNTLHDKFVVVDDETVIVTGANPQSANDARSGTDPATPWHDAGVRVDGAAARSALAAFDGMWTRIARNWDGDVGVPERAWQQSEPESRGNVSVIAVGRNEGSPTGEINPQNVAFVSAIDGATGFVNVLSPNINAEGFENAIVRAIGRGVQVRLITTLGFNYTTMNTAEGRGDNQKIVGNLRRRVKAAHPNHADNLTVCWYARDGGPIPVVGKEEGPSHTKYLSVDGEIAIVGSANMDFGSWRRAHEFNLLIDDPSSVRQMDSALVDADLASSMCSYAELWEGSAASQSFDCPIPLGPNQTIVLEDFKPHFRERVTSAQPSFLASGLCNNDEARSLVLVGAQAGQVLRLFDDHDRDRQDDWLEIVVKRDITSKVISSLESSWEDADVRATHHRNNGLIGNISTVEISDTPSGPIIDLYEGAGGSQNLLCSIPVGTTSMTVRFPSSHGCDNDEASSMVFYNMPADVAVLLFDSPSGQREDDWTLVRTHRSVQHTTIDGFETSIRTPDVDVTHFSNNGLDGKVSRLEIRRASTITGFASLYEGSNGGQNKVCDLLVQNQTVRFKDDRQCDNDEARSIVLSLVPEGTNIRLYDDPRCRTSDDWVEIIALRDIGRVVVGSLERSTTNADVRVTFHRDNGLNGKVSCARIDTA